MELTYPIPVKDYFRVVVEIFDFTPPFSLLRERQKDVFAEFLRYHNEYKDYPDEVRDKLIFDYDTYQKIADKLGVKRSTVYNVTSELRALGLIIDNSIDKRFIIPKLDGLTFKFIENGK
jgi:biotin operon repressor